MANLPLLHVNDRLVINVFALQAARLASSAAGAELFLVFDTHTQTLNGDEAQRVFRYLADNSDTLPAAQQSPAPEARETAEERFADLVQQELP
jgi:hypothetical protein